MHECGDDEDRDGEILPVELGHDAAPEPGRGGIVAEYTRGLFADEKWASTRIALGSGRGTTNAR